jgi:hypothetical protein
MHMHALCDSTSVALSVSQGCCLHQSIAITATMTVITARVVYPDALVCQSLPSAGLARSICLWPQAVRMLVHKLYLSVFADCAHVWKDVEGHKGLRTDT